MIAEGGPKQYLSCSPVHTPFDGVDSIAHLFQFSYVKAEFHEGDDRVTCQVRRARQVKGHYSRRSCVTPRNYNSAGIALWGNITLAKPCKRPASAG